MAVPLLLSVIATVGAVESITSVCVPAELTLPAASVAVTDTELLPLAFRESDPLAGVAEPVLTLQVPSVAVVVYVLSHGHWQLQKDEDRHTVLHRKDGALVGLEVVVV